jgi:ABC-2 type transport system permease protein
MPIFDQGYQHWSGQLAGHTWRWLAVTRHGVRVGLENRVVRRLLFTAWIPALMLVAVVCLWGMTEDKTSWAWRLIRVFGFLRDMADNPREYRSMAWTVAFHAFLYAELYVSMVLVVLVGPALISQDLRYNALPLYFSRPVRRIDYFLGKLGVIGFFLAAVTVVPAVAAWCLGVLFSLDVTVAVDTSRILVAMVLQGLVMTVSAGLFILALSSLTRNSRYVAVAFAGIWIVSGFASHALEQVNRHHTERQAFVADQRMPQLHAELADVNRRLGQGPGPRQPQVVKDPQEHLRLLGRREELVREQQQLMNRHWAEGQTEYDQAQRGDWRPLLSYTANLQRIGVALLGSRAAWEKVDELRDARIREMMAQGGGFYYRGESLASRMTPSYPWWWSGAILLVLAVASVVVLNARVKSLDRLR